MIRICAARGSEAPPWAVGEIARRQRLAGKTGRHANPVAETRDRINQLHIFAAVEAAKSERPDLKGDALFEFVALLLDRYKNSTSTHSITSLKSIYHKVKRSENPMDNVLIPLYQRAIQDPEFEVTIPPLFRIQSSR